MIINERLQRYLWQICFSRSQMKLYLLEDVWQWKIWFQDPSDVRDIGKPDADGDLQGDDLIQQITAAATASKSCKSR